MVIFVWDEAKRLANLAKHGCDFADAGADFDWDDAVTTRTHPGSRGEVRFKSMGMFQARLTVVIFTPLGSEAVSIISMRRADRQERKLYEDEKGQG
jgi:uncharacterized DUF497 family protein